ncbi:MAG TPA: ABC transporter ATP-binding protein [Phycisphaerales bacterium]|nr:ABC transporter ATP-binding protein [Phycisphaerales bacterium]
MIETKDIRVDYGDVTAVRDLTVSIAPGQVFGLIGPNGAGKTSLISVLATLREPTYGEARIAGLDIREDVGAVRRTIGYMPDLAPVYKDLRCWEFLDLFARAYFLDRRDRRARIEQCIELVRLQTKRDAMAGTLSRGMTQRLVLAKTLLHDPSVLLLDEPASGLDPLARVDLRNLLRELGARGKTVVVSSHILNELSEFCTSIGIMEKGRLVLDGDIDTIVAGLNRARRFTIETIGPADSAAAVLEALGDLAGVADLQTDNGRCSFETTAGDEAMADLLAALVSRGVRVKGFFERRRGVEDVLLHVGASEVS